MSGMTDESVAPVVSPSAVFRFRGADLLVPASTTDAEAAYGVDPSCLPSLPQAVSTMDVPMFDGSMSLRLLREAPDAALPEGWRQVGARAALLAAADAAGDGPFEAARLFRACHIAHWRAESSYCGRCGSANGDAPDELARLCPSCGRREYPRISPAVIVLVTDDRDRILLAHNVKFQSAMHSLVAGFVEAGERLEQTVVREVREEVGIEVTDIRYAASQPWPFPDSLMLGFRARYAGGELRPDSIEISDVAWYSRDALPSIPARGSVARALIDAWRAESSS
jgi:NAD+ diphosphatase